MATDYMRTSLDVHLPLRKLTIRMFGKKYTLNPAEDLLVKPSQLGDMLQTQPSKFAFYATVRDMAESVVEALAVKLEQKRSEVDRQYREAGELPGGMKLSEDGIRRCARIDPDCVKIQEALLEAQSKTRQLASIVRAFEHRREMLLALGHRANNSTWNDSDCDVTVAANVEKLDLATVRNIGQHPSKDTVN